MTSLEFEGRVVFITGGTSRIALATARWRREAREGRARGKANHHAHVASKHATVGISRSVAVEWASRAVRINALCPGFTATPAMRGAEAAAPDVVRELVERIPMSRMASEAEIANAAMRLCSPGATFVTGAVIAVDGRFLAA